MKKKILIIFCIAFLIIIASTNIFSNGWIFYNDGPYEGKVVDASTGKIIEGAIVVGVWRLEAYGGPAAPSEPYCDAQETVTDKNGEFTVPKAHCFFLWPFTKMGRAEILIFKPGFDSYPPSLPIIKNPQSKENEKDRQRYQTEYWVDIERDKKNIIKLKEAKSREERKWIANRISVSTIPFEEQSKKAGNFLSLLKREEKYLGLYK